MSILLTAEELRETQETVRAQYRLMKWRSFVPIKRNVPDWAVDFRVVSIQGFAPPPELLNEMGYAPNRRSQPSLQRTDTTFKVYEFGLSYGYSDTEQRYAQRTGLNLGVERAAANNRSFEEFLEAVAFNGDASGTSLLFASQGGIGNLTTTTDPADSSNLATAALYTELPKLAGASNKGWFDLSDGNATASALEMAKDLAYLADQIRVQTKDLNRCTDIVLADVLWKVANRTYAGVDSTRSAIDIFRSQYPGVNVSPWYKFNGAGANTGSFGTHRIMALDASDPDGPQLVLPREMTQSAPYDTADRRGFLVNQDIRVGGVIAKKPQVVAYMDPLNQA